LENVFLVKTDKNTSQHITHQDFLGKHHKHK